MNQQIYGECVRGESHIRKGIECQDSKKVLVLENGTIIIAVADGHGSSQCPFSKSGSMIATNVFCDIICKLLERFDKDINGLGQYLSCDCKYELAREVEAEWKKRVYKAYLKRKLKNTANESKITDKQSVYKQYGTTLLGLLLTSEFVFAFQLGDGDIMYINTEKTESIIEPEKILGIETHSLCKDDAWKKTETFFSLRNNIDSECLYLLSTDGFSNSHKTSHDFYLTCKEYLTMIKEYGFDTVSANLKSWLKETSKLGCGDDITVVMCYCK